MLYLEGIRNIPVQAFLSCSLENITLADGIQQVAQQHAENTKILLRSVIFIFFLEVVELMQRPGHSNFQYLRQHLIWI